MCENIIELSSEYKITRPVKQSPFDRRTADESLRNEQGMSASNSQTRVEADTKVTPSHTHRLASAHEVIFHQPCSNSEILLTVTLSSAETSVSQTIERTCPQSPWSQCLVQSLFLLSRKK